jgi:hypothetical protein
MVYLSSVRKPKELYNSKACLARRKRPLGLAWDSEWYWWLQSEKSKREGTVRHLWVRQKWQENIHTLPYDTRSREESRHDISCESQSSLGGVWRVVMDWWDRDRGLGNSLRYGTFGSEHVDLGRKGRSWVRKCLVSAKGERERRERVYTSEFVGHLLTFRMDKI